MLEHEGNSVNGRSNEADVRHIDEGTVHAWLDGQLSADEAARVERHVAACGACSAVVADARGHIAAATRILNSLDGVPTRVIPQARRWSHQWQLRVAAAIVVMALGTAVFLRGSHSPLSAAHDERALDRVAGPAGQSAPSASIATRPPEPSERALDAEKKSSATHQAVPFLPPANKPAPKASAAPAPAVVGGTLRADRERDLAASAPAAAADTSGAPAVATAPTIENSLQAQAPLAARAVAARRVTGRVVDAEQRAPVPAAQVAIPGTIIGQSTTDSGTFNIAVPADAKSLMVRRIGYMAENVPLTPGTTDYTIPLKKDVLRLESQVVTGAATTIGSQNAATAAKVAAAPENGGESGGGLRLALAGSRCQDRVVRVATGAEGVGLADSTEARLTPTPSQSLDQPGFVVRLVPDTAFVPAGSWQPIGRDSALVKLQGPRAVTQTRVACGGDQP